jgi:hypothetical protein
MEFVEAGGINESWYGLCGYNTTDRDEDGAFPEPDGGQDCNPSALKGLSY